MLACARFLVREANLHGGMGWLDYDMAFRRHLFLNQLRPWNEIDSSLHTSTILNQHSSVLVKELSAPCAGERITRAHSVQCGAFSHQPVPAQPHQQVRSKHRSANIWNKGSCTFPGSCRYRHTCATYDQAHKAKDCPKTPETSVHTTPRGHLPPVSSVA